MSAVAGVSKPRSQGGWLRESGDAELGGKLEGERSRLPQIPGGVELSGLFAYLIKELVQFLVDVIPGPKQSPAAEQPGHAAADGKHNTVHQRSAREKLLGPSNRRVTPGGTEISSTTLRDSRKLAPTLVARASAIAACSRPQFRVRTHPIRTQGTGFRTGLVDDVYVCYLAFVHGTHQSAFRERRKGGRGSGRAPTSRDDADWYENDGQSQTDVGEWLAPKNQPVL